MYSSRMPGVLVKLQSAICSVLFSVLFTVHVFLAVFEIHPHPWISQWMFSLGRASTTTSHGSQAAIQSVDNFDSFSIRQVDGNKPYVIRGFFHKVSIMELMAHAGPSTVVQAHSYENDQLNDETMTLEELVKNIRKGLSTNAKSIVFAEAPDFEPFSGLKERIDGIRGTAEMLWEDLSMQFFIGGVGTMTRCHADPSFNCYLQLSGAKRWRIASPSAVSDLSVLPRGSNISYNARNANVGIEWLVLDLHPGDLLVLPPFWFHEVTNIGEESVVVGLAMNWLSVRHAFGQSVIMAAGSLLRPRLWRRFLSPEVCPVDEEIMRACRQVCSCSVGAPEEKTAAKLAARQKNQ